jgi:hypothetical protein
MHAEVTEHGLHVYRITAGWGKKLAYLLREGWEIEKIQAWAKGRWEAENPRK